AMLPVNVSAETAIATNPTSDSNDLTAGRWEARTVGKNARMPPAANSHILVGVTKYALAGIWFVQIIEVTSEATPTALSVARRTSRCVLALRARTASKAITINS